MLGDPEAATDPSRHPVRRNGGWLPRFVPLFVAALLFAVTAELTARLYWRLCCGISLLKPDQILYAYYPELRELDGGRPAHGDEFYKILFLGESVLHKDWGSVEQELREQLAYLGHRNVRIFNLAMPGHTSRDSWLKYAAVGAARFELVIFCHGVNEARANNAPPKIFREDYGHYSWKEAVNTLAPYHGLAVFALPYTLHYLTIRTRSALAEDRYVPTHNVRKDWVQYGRDFRSAASFKRNLTAILDLASQRGEQVLLATVPYYVPENYSFEAFKKQQLDYGLHYFPIESWGLREHVLATVAVHNEIVRSMVGQYDNILFVDQASLTEGAGRYFNDPFHPTALGSTKFVENVLRVLLSSDKRNILGRKREGNTD